MAESGCLKSEKLHTLTVTDDIVTNNFETREHMSLTLGTESYKELNDSSADLINGTFKDVNKDNDADQNTNTVGEYRTNNNIEFDAWSNLGEGNRETGLGFVFYNSTDAGSTISTEVGSGSLRTGLGETIEEISATQTLAQEGLHASGGSSSNTHRITQPPMSILKNMYVIVQNNNVSISQFIGTGLASSTSHIDALLSAGGDHPLDLTNYKDISLRLKVERKVGEVLESVFEDTAGGNIDHFVRGNDVTAVTPTEVADASARELADFRHSGALLPKNTIIPIVSNYLFSTQAEKHRSILANGYIHPSATLDSIRLSQDANNLDGISFSNFTDNETDFYVTLDAGGDDNADGLTGITQGVFTNDILTVGATGGEAEGENGLKAINGEDVGSNLNYLSNKVRDSTFINPEISIEDRQAGIDTGIPKNMYAGGGLALGGLGPQTQDTINQGTKYKNNVVFKVICDFQRIDQ